METKLTTYQDMLFSEHVAKADYHKVGKKTTVCLLTLLNGFEIVGTSACVNPADFNETIGNHFALVSALDKLDELIGFARQCGL